MNAPRSDITSPSNRDHPSDASNRKNTVYQRTPRVRCKLLAVRPYRRRPCSARRSKRLDSSLSTNSLHRQTRSSTCRSCRDCRRLFPRRTLHHIWSFRTCRPSTRARRRHTCPDSHTCPDHCTFPRIWAQRTPHHRSLCHNGISRGRRCRGWSS